MTPNLWNDQRRYLPDRTRRTEIFPFRSPAVRPATVSAAFTASHSFSAFFQPRWKALSGSSSPSRTTLGKRKSLNITLPNSSELNGIGEKSADEPRPPKNLKIRGEEDPL